MDKTEVQPPSPFYHWKTREKSVTLIHVFSSYQADILVMILESLDFIHHQVFIRLLKNTTFWELDLFPSSGVGQRHLLSIRKSLPQSLDCSLTA
jgi:hypothetical protein